MVMKSTDHRMVYFIIDIRKMNNCSRRSLMQTQTTKAFDST